MSASLAQTMISVILFAELQMGCTSILWWFSFSASEGAKYSRKRLSKVFRSTAKQITATTMSERVSTQQQIPAPIPSHRNEEAQERSPHWWWFLWIGTQRRHRAQSIVFLTDHSNFVGGSWAEWYPVVLSRESARSRTFIQTQLHWERSTTS